jgi:GTP cyclohydrolase I
MTDKVILTHREIGAMAAALAETMTAGATIYPIPRGGVPVAYLLLAFKPFKIVSRPEEATYIVDDLIDSGATMERALVESEVGGAHRAQARVLIDKPRLPAHHPHRGWIVFPWEVDAVGSMEDTVRRMLQFIGDDASRGGLDETPARVAKAWQYWGRGYNMDPADILKTFEDGAENVNEMVMVRDIPFYTHCEHHMAPFFGTATIAYIPDGRIVGLSKLSRLLDCFAARLQVQERLTTQVADALMEHLKPKGVGVIINARHLCMESRGVCKQGHSTTTSALRGVMFSGEPRAEFLSLSR